MKKIDDLKNIVKISTSESTILVIDNQGKAYYKFVYPVNNNRKSAFKINLSLFNKFDKIDKIYRDNFTVIALTKNKKLLTFDDKSYEKCRKIKIDELFLTPKRIFECNYNKTKHLKRQIKMKELFLN